ncbi:MAG: GntR family transcriptional regulator [Anaerolineales bacterium]|nr:GntR family transcriptional regulator [Anaerolineales bacterium]
MGEPIEERATDRAERHLIEGIVSGTFPPNTDLPGERTLSKNLDIARPALREAMQRLSRDGWLDIQQGKPTRIRDYLKDGNLNILAGLLKTDSDLVPNLVPDLLEMWQLLAPQYTASSTRRAPGLIIDLLNSFSHLPDNTEAYAQSMWKLHHMLIAYCDNLVYGLIFNTFKDFYHQLATYYYTNTKHRELARNLWEVMIPSIKALDAETSSQQVSTFISTAAEFWKNITFEQYQKEVFDDPRQIEGKKKEKKTKK